MLEENTITENTLCGVNVEHGGNPLLRDNQLQALNLWH
jgi:parallel beta-helix repeat protein